MFYKNVWFSSKTENSFSYLHAYKMQNQILDSPYFKPVCDKHGFDDLKTLSCFICDQTVSFVRFKIAIGNRIFNYNQSHGFIEQLKDKPYCNHPKLSGINGDWKNDSCFTMKKWDNVNIIKDFNFATVSYVNILQAIEHVVNNRFAIVPCNLDWSKANSRRFSLSVKNGKCLRFSAASLGDIFVVFATNPKNPLTWYYLQISPHGVALYKVCVDFPVRKQASTYS
jgi:hypothetical protein